MARLVRRVVQLGKKGYRWQRIRSLEPLFAKLLARELLESSDYVSFPEVDSNDEKDRPNESVVLLRPLVVDLECSLAFHEHFQTQTLAGVGPQPWRCPWQRDWIGNASVWYSAMVFDRYLQAVEDCRL